MPRSRVVLLAAAAALLAVAAWSLHPRELTERAFGAVQGLGPWTIPVFILLYAAACLVFLPASVLTIGAGAAFGPAKALVWVLVAAELGAVASFLVARYLARAWVAKHIEDDARFRVIDAAVSREGWKIVLLTRLSPVFPFHLQNYAYGLTQVRLRDYAWATAVGMIPGTTLFVMAGAGLMGGRSWAQWGLYLLGLAAAIGAAAYATRVAKAALRREGLR